MTFSFLRIALLSLGLSVAHIAIAQSFVTAPVNTYAKGAKRLISISPLCGAYLRIFSDPVAFSIAWNGDCEDGLAHGPGVMYLHQSSGKLLSISLGVYDKGHWISASETYLLRRDKIIYQTPNVHSGLFNERLVTAQDLPPWAVKIGSAQPSAKKEWDAEVIARLKFVAQINDTESSLSNTSPDEQIILF